MAGALKHLGNQLPPSCRRLLANGFLISRATYLIAVWGGATPNHITRIQAVLNGAARYITGMPRRTKSRTVMELCNWMSIPELARYQSLCHSNVETSSGGRPPLSIHRRITMGQ